MIERLEAKPESTSAVHITRLRSLGRLISAHLLHTSQGSVRMNAAMNSIRMKSLNGGRSQDRTVDLLLVRLPPTLYITDSNSGDPAQNRAFAASSALIAHDFAHYCGGAWA